MCIKCEIKKAALAAAGMNLVEEKVATISLDFVKELGQLDEAHERLLKQIDEEENQLVEAATKEIQAKLKAKYGKKMDDLSNLQEKVITDALTAAGADPKLTEKEYRIVRNTGEVFIRELQPKVAQGIH